MTLARQFDAFITSVFLVALTLATTLTLTFARITAEGARLTAGLERTLALNQALVQSNAELTSMLEQRLLEPRQRPRDDVRSLVYQVGSTYAEYLKLDLGNDERLTVERAKALQTEFNTLSTRVLGLEQIGTPGGAALHMARLSGLRDGIRDELDKLGHLQVAKLHGIVTHLSRSALQGIVAIVALGLTLIVTNIGAAVMFRRRVLGPVRELLRASEAVRGGNLSVRAPARGLNEIGQLTQGFNTMADALAGSYADLERRVQERTAELQEMQHRLAQSEKMSAVGLLVSGVAHELNNPLAVIGGFTELALQDLESGNGNDRVAPLLRDVDAQVERCRRIIGNLLQFVRYQEPRLDTVDLNGAIEEVLSLRTYELETRNTKVVRDLDPSNPVVAADRSKLQQVVLNLLNNAHQAILETGRPGTIWVRTRSEGDSLTIEFVDDGPGFVEPARAMDPFYTTKAVGQGTGLGLSVCRGIVEEHKGEIHLGNRERGAQVTVTLPRRSPDGPPHQAAPEAAVAAAHRPARLPKSVALVVDDETSLLRLQKAFLARMGVEAICVTTGAEAIECLKGHSVQIIVSDVRMPGAIDGIGLYEWVQTNRPDLRRRFLFSSGDLVGLGLGAGAKTAQVPWIQKPFKYEEYERAIRAALVPEFCDAASGPGDAAAETLRPAAGVTARGEGDASVGELAPGEEGPS